MTMPPRTLIDITINKDDSHEVRQMLNACRTVWEDAMKHRNEKAIKNGAKLMAAIRERKTAHK